MCFIHTSNIPQHEDIFRASLDGRKKNDGIHPIILEWRLNFFFVIFPGRRIINSIGMKLCLSIFHNDYSPQKKKLFIGWIITSLSFLYFHFNTGGSIMALTVKHLQCLSMPLLLFILKPLYIYCKIIKLNIIKSALKNHSHSILNK